MSDAPRKSYPRSLPFRPPDDVLSKEAAQFLQREAALRRWVLLLVALVAVLIAVVGGVGFLVLSREQPPRDPPGARGGPEKTEPSPQAALPPAPAGQPEGRVPVKQAADEKPAPPRPEGKKPPEARAPLPMPAAAVPADRLIEAVGGLTAAHLYQTYLNIGFLADATEGDVYSQADAKKLLETVTGIVDAVEKQLDRITEAGLKAEDQKALQDTRRLLTPMRTQIKELQAYWETGEKEHATLFHKAREETWAGIKSLLGIQEKEAEMPPKEAPKKEPPPGDKK
jgi:hypothetical protein